MYLSLHVKYPLFLSDLNNKNLKYQISLKTVQWKPSCSMRTDTWTDGRIDKHEEANGFIPQIFESA